MRKLEKTIAFLYRIDNKSLSDEELFSPLSLLIVTFAYLIFLLSIPIGKLSMLLWFFIWPVIGAPLTGLDYSKLFMRSLVILPFVVLLGIFNPIFNRDVSFTIMNIGISKGWISFISIVIRGLLSTQALFILIFYCGLKNIGKTLKSLKFPPFVITIIDTVYRYMVVLLEEMLEMTRARMARGYNKRGFNLKIWAALTGQLFIRTVNRAHNIHKAMLARGFKGKIIYLKEDVKWRKPDTILVISTLVCFSIMRFIDLSGLLFSKY